MSSNDFDQNVGMDGVIYKQLTYLSCSTKVKYNECLLFCLLATWMASAPCSDS